MRLLILLLLLPALCFGQYRPDRARTNPSVTDGAGYGFRGHKEAIVNSNSDLYCTEADSLFARFDRAGTEPTDERKGLINTFIVNMKAGGYWSRFDALGFFSSHDRPTATIYWNKDDSVTNVGNPAFEIDRGFTPSSGKYLNSNFNPAVDGVQYTQNSASMWCYIRTTCTTYSMGAISADFLQQAWICHLYGGVAGYANINVNATPDGQVAFVPPWVGLLVGSRPSSSALKFSQNGFIYDITDNSASPPSLDLFIGTVNYNGSPDAINAAQFAFWAVGDGFSDVEINAVQTIVETYLDAIGAGVIP